MTTIFRRPTEEDKEVLLNWIALDPEHSAKGMTPDFFFKDDTLPMVIGDLCGPGLYVRLDSEPPDSVRLHVQFGPDKVRSGKSLLRAWPTFRAHVEASGVKRMVFESLSPQLVGFCRRCFGFTSVPGTDDFELMLGE